MTLSSTIRSLVMLCLLYTSNLTFAQLVETNYRHHNPSFRSIVKHGAKIFSGSDRGVYVSTDNTVTWQAANNGLSNTDVYELLSDGTNLFAATATAVFRSTDNGVSWTPTTLHEFVIQLESDGVGLVAASAGLYVSLDAGITWTEKIPSIQITSLAKSGSNLLASTSLGEIWSSADHGATWTQRAALSNYIITMTAAGSHAFAGLLDSRVMHSTDAGLTWTQLMIQPETAKGMIVLPAGAILMATSFSIYRSSDDGNSWSTVFTPFSISMWGFSEVNGKAYAHSDDSGVLVSNTTGSSWQYYGNPPRVPQGMSGSATTLLVTTFNQIYRSLDGGDTWLEYPNLVGDYIRELNPVGTSYLARTDIGKIYRSTDDGVSWQIQSTGIASETVQDISISASTAFAATDHGAYVSLNQGSSWSATTLTVPVQYIGAGSDGSTVYALSTASGLYRSLNGGSTWALLSGVPPGFVECFITVGNTPYVGTSTGLYTIVAGNAWGLISPSLNGKIIKSMATDGALLFYCYTQFIAPNVFTIESYFGGTISSLFGNLYAAIPPKLLPLGTGLYVGMDYNIGGNVGMVSRGELVPQVMISSLSPSNVTVGSTLTIQGLNFSPTPAMNKVEFAIPGSTVVGTVLAASPTSLQVAVPATAGNVSLSVTVNGMKGTFSNLLPIAPQIQSFSPIAAPIGGVVTLRGSGFGGASAPVININGVQAQGTITVGSTQELKFSVPTLAYSGQLNLTMNGFTVSHPTTMKVIPLINTVSKSKGTQGDTITIEGIGFEPTAVANSVKFNNEPGTVISATLISYSGATFIWLKVIVPVEATSGALSVETPGGVAYGAIPFMVTPPCPFAIPKPYITIGLSASFNYVLTSSSPTGNQWFRNGVLIAGETGSQLEIPIVNAGAYSLQVEMNGCLSPTSDEFEVVDLVTGSLERNHEARMFPNPASDRLWFAPSSEPLKVAIFDTTGRKVMQMDFAAGTNPEMGIESLAPNLYVVCTDTGSKRRVYKLVKK